MQKLFSYEANQQPIVKGTTTDLSNNNNKQFKQ